MTKSIGFQSPLECWVFRRLRGRPGDRVPRGPARDGSVPVGSLEVGTRRSSSDVSGTRTLTSRSNEMNETWTDSSACGPSAAPRSALEADLHRLDGLAPLEPEVSRSR